MDNKLEPNNEHIWKFKRYLNLGYETIEVPLSSAQLARPESLINLIKNKYGLKAVEIINTISKDGKLFNRSHLINALAICARQPDDIDTKKAAYKSLKSICMEPDELFLFISKCEEHSLMFGLEKPKEEKKTKLEKRKKDNEIIDKNTNIVTETITQIRLSSAKSTKSEKNELKTPRISSAQKDKPAAASPAPKVELKLPRLTSADSKKVEKPIEPPPKPSTPTNPEIVFVDQNNKCTGWGRAHKSAIKDWYLSLKPLQLAKFITESPKKFKWNHRDVFRLCHIKTENPVYNLVIIYVNAGMEKARNFYLNSNGKDEFVYEYLAKNKKQIKATYKLTNELHQELTSVYEYLSAFEEIKVSLDEKPVLELCKKHEFHIDQALKIKKSTNVWQFGLENDLVPLKDLLKKLPDLSKNELLTDELTHLICQKIENEELIKKSNLHPFNWYTIQKVYAKGGKNYYHRFKPNEKVLKSIENAFNMSFSHLEVNERKFAVCLNTWILSKQLLHKSTLVTPYQAGVIMLLCSLHSHPNSKLFLIKEKLEQIEIKKEEMNFSILVQKLFQNTIGSINIAENISSFGENFDGIIIYSGIDASLKNKPSKALKAYREKFNNPNTKLVYVSLNSTHTNVADPNDSNMLDINGFAHDYPNILDNYLKGLF